ncbi:hypothetical protein [Micromonospora sp. HK10]|uniref:hypothetical protein n=1 Tax=Micromonospora sp. HK10 TaxID=1538294 RepID=UPI001E407653|nr:hypothetical protein [Micromonospora sp. HK10]
MDAGQVTGTGTLTSRTIVGGDVRAETDLRLAGATDAGLRLGRVDVRVGGGRLTVREAGGASAQTALPARLDLADPHNGSGSAPATPPVCCCAMRRPATTDQYEEH